MPDAASGQGLCIAVCTLEAPPPLTSVLRAVGGSVGTVAQAEILLVHGRPAQPRIQAMLREITLPLQVVTLVVERHGFSNDRRAALEWASVNRRGWSVLFLDDDDVPDRDLVRRLWEAHLARPGDIVTGVVVGLGRPEPVGEGGVRPVEFHGASTMLIPGELVGASVPWLPLWVDHCGGEDTALCAEARKRGIRIWEVSGAVAREVKPAGAGESAEHQARRALHEAWVFSALCRAGVISGRRASRAGRLGTATWNLLVATVLGLKGSPLAAKRRFARGVGGLCGLILTPLPRAWLYYADAPRRREGGRRLVGWLPGSRLR